MTNLIEQNVPKVRRKKYTNKPKWWTPELLRLKNRRDKLFKRKSDVKSGAEYEAALCAFNELNDHRYQEYIRRTQENIKSNPSEFWKYAKINGGSDKYPDEMQNGDRVGKTSSDVVNLFADYFESIYVPDEEPWDFDDDTFLLVELKI